MILAQTLFPFLKVKGFNNVCSHIILETLSYLACRISGIYLTVLSIRAFGWCVWRTKLIIGWGVVNSLCRFYCCS